MANYEIRYPVNTKHIRTLENVLKNLEKICTSVSDRTTYDTTKSDLEKAISIISKSLEVWKIDSKENMPNLPK